MDHSFAFFHALSFELNCFRPEFPFKPKCFQITIVKSCIQRVIQRLNSKSCSIYVLQRSETTADLTR